MMNHLVSSWFATVTMAAPELRPFDLVVVGEKQWSCSMATLDVRLVSSVDIPKSTKGEAVRFSHAEKFPISGPLSTFQHAMEWSVLI
jgi:hypothetical protein